MLPKTNEILPKINLKIRQNLEDCRSSLRDLDEAVNLADGRHEVRDEGLQLRLEVHRVRLVPLCLTNSAEFLNSERCRSVRVL